MRLAKAQKKSKRGIFSRWKRQIVVNSMQARLRAQLGDRSKYSGERRRRSVVVASIVLTITDPLRGSYPLLCNLQAALIRSCGASFACMELTIISRFQRLQTSRKYSLHSLQTPMYRHIGNTPSEEPSLWWCGDFLFYTIIQSILCSMQKAFLPYFCSMHWAFFAIICSMQKAISPINR